MSDVIGFPLSPQQELAWRALGAGSAAFVCAVIHIDGPVEHPAVHDALNRIVARHEILRTTFINRPGWRSPLQVVDPDAAVTFEIEDLSLEDDATQKRKVDAAFQELRQDRTLAQLPTVCARLLSLGHKRHALLLSLPALTVDAQTLNLLTDGLALAYVGIDISGDVLQYADYAEWQRQELESPREMAVNARAFWHRAEAEPSPVFSSVFQTQGGPAVFRCEPIRGDVPRDVWNRVVSLAREVGTTPDRVCLAAWQTVISRVTGHERLATRVLTNGRINADLANAFGPYARALPIVVNVDGQVSFCEFVQQSTLALDEARSQELFCSCDLGAGLDVVFEWQDRVTRAAGGLEWSLLRCDAHSSRFALKLSCASSAEGLTTTLWYDADALTRQETERLGVQFEALLKSACEDAMRPVAAISMLGPGAMAAQSSGTGSAPPVVRMDAWIATQAIATPMATAVVGQDETLTYAGLMTRAAQIAEWLETAGVQHGAVVGVCGERSAGLLTAVLGVWQAGAAYLPIGPDQPAARSADQLAETSASAVVVTRASERAALGDYQGPVLVLGETALPSALPRSTGGTADDTAYVLYTSGSTGRPKGVMVRHRNLAAYSFAIVETLQATGVGGAGTAWATVSALTADLGNTCIFPALVSGGCVHLVPPAATLDAAALGAYMTRHAVDVLKITPSHLMALLDNSGAMLPLKALIFGGEALSWKVIAAVRGVSACALWNHYGPTETTVGALMFPVPESGRTRTVPIGRPLGQTTVAVVDAAGAIGPIGVAGELWIGGPGVSAGYVGKAAQTTERFVSPAWSSGAMYRTGDRVVMDGAGIVEFLGRLDDQVKVRGYRVEPGEVQHVLQGVPGVSEAAVVAVGEGGDCHLVAYYIAPVQVTDTEVRAALAGRLPEYMVPSVLVRATALPRLPNGKVDRRALANAAPFTPVAIGAILPRNPVEESLCEIWQSLLKRPAVGIDEHFFEIGGHSLLATRLVAQIRRTFDLQLPLRSIFERPTIITLAELISQRLDERSQAAAGLLEDVAALSDSEVQAMLERVDAD